MKLSSKYFAIFCLLLGSIFFVSPANAKVVTVGCAGATGGPFNYTTLSAAIQANPTGNVEIDVSGTCTEAVVVAGAQNLVIVGTPGSSLLDPGGSPPNFGAVLEIDNSQNVTVQGLLIGVTSRTIADAIPGILVQSSDVRIVQDRIEGAGASDGIDMFQATVRLIGASIIENNNDGQGNGSGVGLFGPGSQLLLLNDFSGNCPVLQGNDTGIFAGRGGTVVRAPFGRGCVTIQNNAFAAVIANLGATIDLNVPQANPGSIKLVSNLFGLYAQNGSHFILSGPVLIQGNSIDGIRLRTASGALLPSDGASGPTIQGNGSNLHPPCCAPSAGIAVANNGSLDIQAGLVAHNGAPGILIEDNSSVRLIGPLSITRNPVGVQITDVSSAAFFLAPSVSGNTRVDVACGPESVAHGDASAVGTSHCPQFRHHKEFSAESTRRNKPMP